MKEFILLLKKQLTDDVFELSFSSSTDMLHIAWQFVTFILPEGIGGRSYSLLSSNKNEFTLIIKRVADGEKGSIYLCDANKWDTFQWVGPVGKFVLQDEKNAKLFAGTGTGIVPLYNQIVSTLESWNTEEICLFFGVRTKKDLFYTVELEALEKKYPNFSVKYALSREESEEYYNGYITDFVNDQIVQSFDEVYLCWAPVVVDAMELKLKEHNYKQENIYTEKY